MADSASRDVGAVSAINYHIILRSNGAFYGLYTYTENDDNDYLTVLALPSLPNPHLYLVASRKDQPTSPLGRIPMPAF